MAEQKNEQLNVKSELHPRNKHKGAYDFKTLVTANPELQAFVLKNKQGTDSINFFDNHAVKALNKALLLYHYELDFWDIPAHYLCPPIPGRAEYIHRLADMLHADKRIDASKSINCLDIGVGANCIYPIIGVKEYGWNFVGSDIDQESLKSAQKIIENNTSLKDRIQLRHQNNPEHIFNGIIKENDHFQISICNPPFHASAKEAQKGTLRKLRNLKGKDSGNLNLNFGGQSNELWCKGGEKQFVVNMIRESREYSNSVLWFTTLVSKETNLPRIYKTLKYAHVKRIKTIEMALGNKKSRIVCWSFFGS